jgi:hypothetical protein
VFAASSLGGVAREQYAAIEAGGGAVEAPPKRGSSKTGQPQAAAAKTGFSPHQKGVFPGWRNQSA